MTDQQNNQPASEMESLMAQLKDAAAEIARLKSDNEVPIHTPWFVKEIAGLKSQLAAAQAENERLRQIISDKPASSPL